LDLTAVAPKAAAPALKTPETSMKKFTKLSQKERKKLAFVPDVEASSPPPAPVEVKPAWGGWATPAVAAAEVGSGKAIPSLTAIMQVEARSRSGDEAFRSESIDLYLKRCL